MRLRHPHHAPLHHRGDGADELTGPDFDLVTADATSHTYIVILTGG
jgi:hypothetical protein